VLVLFAVSGHWVLSGVGIVMGLALLAYLVIIRPRRLREATELSRTELQEQERSSHPCLKWAGSSTNNIELTHDFQNEGGLVSDLAVQTQPPIVAVIDPKDKLQPQMTGSIKFTAKEGKLAFPLKFELRYTTELNKRCKQRFWLEAAHRLPERLR
jgi:hypothetical protein